MSLPATSPEAKNLEQTYRSLAPEARKVVQIMSVFYHSMPLQGDLSNAMGFLSATGRTPQQMFEHLKEIGMLEHKQGAGWECNPLVKELATRDLIRNGDFERIAKPVQAICKVPPPPRLPELRTYWQLMRELRLALYRSDWDRMQTLMGRARTFAEFESNHPFVLICTRPFDPEWFSALPQRLRESMVKEILNHETRRLSRADELLEWVKPQSRIIGEYLFYTANDLCLQGRFAEARELLAGCDVWYALQLQAWVSFAQGDVEGMRDFFKRAFKHQKSQKMDRYLDVMPEQIFLSSCLQAQDPDGQAYVQEVMKTTGGSPRFARWETAWRSQSPDAKVRAPVPDGKEMWYDALVTGVVGVLVDPAAAKAGAPVYRHWMQVAQANGFHWVAGEFQAILSRLDEAVQCPAGPHLVDLARPKPRWERALQQLTTLGEEAARRRADVRLCWHLKLSGTQAIVFPREQRRDQQGEWGKGRPMAVKRLWEQQTADFLTDQDRAVVATIQQVKSAHGSMEHELDMPRAIRSLVGHPLLFLEDTDDTIDLVHGRPILEVREDGEELVVTLVPAGEGEWAVVPDGPSRYRLVTFTPDQLSAAAILGKGLRVPKGARSGLEQAVAAISAIVTVHSDVVAGGTGRVVEADGQLRVNVWPRKESMRFEIVVCPLGPDGPQNPPGQGAPGVLATVGGESIATNRNLAGEKEAWELLRRQCPNLPSSWVFETDSLQDGLEILLQLQAADPAPVLQYREGRPLKLPQAGLGEMKVKVSTATDWLSLSGEIKVGDTTADLNSVLAMCMTTPSRFLAIDENQFLALTAELRERLDTMRSIASRDGKAVKMHRLTAPLLEDLMEGCTFSGDKGWKELLKKIKEARDHHAKVPSTLQAELRPYQEEGFRWLARSASWQVGACLADDMGLGKTVQTLTLLLARAKEGPTLVVAPASVCQIWIDEAARFAPTLRMHTLWNGDRQQIVKMMGPFDVLVTSYGLLLQEEALLSTITWGSIVLDEAQNIKNEASKRSQAAKSLQAQFRMVATGTPIENHLGELWNLFDFLNPGLLGNRDTFVDRFVSPMEKGDRTSLAILRKLVSPFILRRRKSDVLKELPPRTEITMPVMLSEQEAALYEVLRQQALDRLEDPTVQAGEKHLRVLAELMKLRRVCCHPRLVAPELGLEASKLKLFEEILDELLDNNHKTLVFSQFVDHLTVVREALDRKGVSYQYLDGSTPQKERKAAVEAFQAGEGDVFLISLRAGGFGLNLTAADYVVHMDPWWNPAVEDQASDRAHRIGQQRPVTVYRLVAKGTIEEKMLELHRSKRELADGLLEGTDAGGKLTTEQLMSVLREASLHA